MPNSDLIKKVTFLIADDMESLRSVIVSCLRKLGAEKILQCRDGYDAWNLLTSKNIDIIISDWDMPKLNGLELLKKVRGSTEHKATPFLLVTSSTEKSRVKQALSHGVDDYLAKPFTPKDLDYRVIKLLDKHKRRQTIE